jgi:hypothetical protein
MAVFCFQDFGDFGETRVFLPARRLRKDDGVPVLDECASVIRIAVVVVPREREAVLLDFWELLCLPQLLPLELVEPVANFLNVFPNTGFVLIRAKFLQSRVTDDGQHWCFKGTAARTVTIHQLVEVLNCPLFKSA